MVTKKIIFSAALFSIVIIFLGSLSFSKDHAAYAITSVTLNVTSCPTYGGTWNTTSSICTISTSGHGISTDVELVIPSGTTLVISNTGGTGLANSGTITNSGKIIVANSEPYTYGISNDGTITNNSGGQITLENSSFSGAGITNGNTIINSGTITISNGDTFGIVNFGTITNNSEGTIMISDSGFYGIANGNTITNSGTITIANTGDYGIINDGTITNNSGGQITVKNDVGIGIANSGNIGNSGTITNKSGATIDNTGIIKNYCHGIFTNNGTFSANPIINACTPVQQVENLITWLTKWGRSMELLQALTQNSLLSSIH